MRIHLLLGCFSGTKVGSIDVGASDLLVLGGIAFPVGFFLLGWADTVGQLFGLIFIGSAFLLIFQASQTSIGFYTISTPADVCSFEQAGINCVFSVNSRLTVRTKQEI